MAARHGCCLWMAALSIMGACADETPVLAPRVVTPPRGSTAYPYDGADVIVLSIARANDPQPVQEVTVALGDELALPETPFARDLVVHMSALASGVEISYGRTCAVDMLPDAPALEPVLYLSRIVRWGQGGRPISAHRIGALAYAAPDGSALFFGGDQQSSSERFDPLQGQYVGLDVELAERQGAVLAAVADGRALIIGGLDPDGNLAEEIEVVDPDPDLARDLQLQRAPGPGVYEHAAATLVDGSVLVAGGRASNGQGQGLTVTDRGWVIGFGDGDVLDPPRLLPSRMTAARAGHTMTRLGDELGADVLVVGGRDGTGTPLASCELYRPLREDFEPLAEAQLAHPRWQHRAVRMPGGFVLILGGLTRGPSGDVPVLELELYDPGQGRMTTAGNLPEGAGVIEQSVTPLPDGRVLVAGGRDASGQVVASAFIARLDPIDGQVDMVPTDSLRVARAGHAAVRLCDGTVLVVGGTQDSADAERYNPPSLGRR